MTAYEICVATIVQGAILQGDSSTVLQVTVLQGDYCRGDSYINYCPRNRIDDLYGL